MPPPHSPTPFPAGLPSSSPPWAPAWIQPSQLCLLWSTAPHFYPVSFFTGRDVKATDTPLLRPLPVALSRSRVAFQHFRIDTSISPTLHKGRLRHREVKLPKVTGLGNGPSTKFKTGQSGFRICASQIGTGLIWVSSSAPSHLSANPLAKRARLVNSLNCFIELSPSRFLEVKAKAVLGRLTIRRPCCHLVAATRNARIPGSAPLTAFLCLLSLPGGRRTESFSIFTAMAPTKIDFPRYLNRPWSLLSGTSKLGGGNIPVGLEIQQRFEQRAAGK